MRSACPILASRFSTICLTRGKTSGVSVSIHRGQIWTRSCREQNIPLFALESQDPVKDFDFLGITIQYEMCYTNILQILDLSRHSTAGKRAYRRRSRLSSAADPVRYNPEPLAEFFDLFYIGEGRNAYILNCWILYKTCEQSRKEPYRSF